MLHGLATISQVIGLARSFDHSNTCSPCAPLECVTRALDRDVVVVGEVGLRAEVGKQRKESITKVENGMRRDNSSRATVPYSCFSSTW